MITEILILMTALNFQVGLGGGVGYGILSPEYPGDEGWSRTVFTELKFSSKKYGLGLRFMYLAGQYMDGQVSFIGIALKPRINILEPAIGVGYVDRVNVWYFNFIFLPGIVFPVSISNHLVLNLSIENSSLIGRNYHLNPTIAVAFAYRLGKIRKEEGIHKKNGHPISQPPRLSFDYSFFDENQNEIIDGGEKVYLRITVRNQGKGLAKGVKVLLSGNSNALNYLGSEKNIGDILPDSEKIAIFETLLPYQIDANEGNIIIKVTEAQGFGALDEKEITVAMQPAKVKRESEVVSVLIDVDQPLDQSSFKREDAYAVIIGITDYRSIKIPEVKYAKRDAEVVKDYLINLCGFPEGNIKFIVGEMATIGDIQANIEEWLGRNVSKNSFVFVYFAGHGTPNPEKGDAYLVPYDGEPGFVSKLYPLTRLYNSLEQLPTDNIVVAIDACFSGAGGRSVMEEGKRPLGIAKLPEVNNRISVITASAADEISQDLDSKKHGLFTYYFLKGLRGEADTNGDGWITLGELYNYCQPKILQESKKLGYTQTPKIFPEPLGDKANLKVGKVK